MPNPRATVTIAALTLVADLGQYKPFGEAALGVTVFDGIDATTIQDFGMHAHRQTGSLGPFSGTSPGLLSAAQLLALENAVSLWGAAQSLTDSLGNAGTVKVIRFARGFEYNVPGAQVTLYGYELGWRWLTLTQKYGAPYTGL